MHIYLNSNEMNEEVKICMIIEYKIIRTKLYTHLELCDIDMYEID